MVFLLFSAIFPFVSSEPKEYYFEIEEENFLHLRVSITPIGEHFNSEIALVQKENSRIFRHIDILYKLPDLEEALSLSLQRYKRWCDETFKPQYH